MHVESYLNKDGVLALENLLRACKGHGYKYTFIIEEGAETKIKVTNISKSKLDNMNGYFCHGCGKRVMKDNLAIINNSIICGDDVRCYKMSGIRQLTYFYPNTEISKTARMQALKGELNSIVNQLKGLIEEVTIFQTMLGNEDE